MVLSLSISSEIEAKSKVRAQAAGQEIAQYVERLLVDDLADFGAGAHRGHSIWDSFGRSPSPRTSADIHAFIQSERESWDDQ